ncbi:high frequency lysogenization protein HflD [Otariodibacter sp.]|uniref:high frequency lysogenization protein HflD n=1 Tax=Otariodibacter sp. TaxID=3030919 RepID=UPI0026231A1F|nr:high frequency lysogenization protein HflD [Otariodibacter sp.]
MVNYQDISIALAGVCQTATLVQQLAHNGHTSQEYLKYSFSSLLATQPKTTLDVYDNDLNHLKLGFETILSQFGGGQGKIDTEIGRYWVGVLALSQKLSKSSQTKQELAKRIETLIHRRTFYENDGDLLNEKMIANMANIYSECISPLGAKIKVLGVSNYLSLPHIQNNIRASLLAGVRAGILWQQVGGSRWQLFFSRKKILTTIQSLYSSL